MACAHGDGKISIGSRKLLLELARKRKILFFGGKGGVGKTTVSSAVALARADEGAKVLLVSTDPAHNLGHLFDRTIGPKPVCIKAGLDALEVDPTETVDEHLNEVRHALHTLMPVTQHGEIDKHMALSRDAPGMHEAAILERIADIVEQGVANYDLIVFDTAPSGHTARLMLLPEMMSAWTEGLIKRRDKADRFAQFVKQLGSDTTMEDKTIGGQSEQTKESRIRQILLRRKHKFSHLRDHLSDTDATSFVIVLAAERLPILETIELNEQLGHAGIEVECMVVNKRAPLGMGEFLDERHKQEEQHLKLLDQHLCNIQRQDLYLQNKDILGLEGLETLALSL